MGVTHLLPTIKPDENFAHFEEDPSRSDGAHKHAAYTAKIYPLQNHSHMNYHHALVMLLVHIETG